MKTLKFTRLLLIVLLFTICMTNSCQKNNDINIERIAMLDKTLPAKYGEIFEQLATTVFLSDKSSTISEISDSFINNLSEEYLILLDRQQTRSQSQDYSFCLSDSLIAVLKPYLFVENLNELDGKIEDVLNSDYFENLSDEMKEQCSLELYTLKYCRDGLVNVIVKVYNGEVIITKLSPGDRMIWSEISQNMSEEDRENIVQAGLLGMGLTGSAVGVIASIVGYLIGFNW